MRSMPTDDLMINQWDSSSDGHSWAECANEERERGERSLSDHDAREAAAAAAAAARQPPQPLNVARRKGVGWATRWRWWRLEGEEGWAMLLQAPHLL